MRRGRHTLGISKNEVKTRCGSKGDAVCIRDDDERVSSVVNNAEETEKVSPE